VVENNNPRTNLDLWCKFPENLTVFWSSLGIADKLWVKFYKHPPGAEGIFSSDFFVTYDSVIGMVKNHYNFENKVDKEVPFMKQSCRHLKYMV
jgi:hypothetical protein